VAYGTAPHRIAPGVWATRDGRRLTPAGSAYWEHHYHQGRVSEDGHITRPQTVDGRPSLVMKPVPAKAIPLRQPSRLDYALAQAANSGQTDPNRADVKAATARVKLYNRNRGTTLGLKDVKQAAKAYAEYASPLALPYQVAKHSYQGISDIYLAQDQAAAVKSLQTDKRLTPTQKASALRQWQVQQAGLTAPHGLNKWLDRLAGGAIEMGVETPSSLAYAAQHPIPAAKAMAGSIYETGRHPVRQFKEEPAVFFANLLGGKAAIGGLAGRTEAAVAAARGGRPTSLGEAVRAIPIADRRAYAVLTNPERHLQNLDEMTLDRIQNPSGPLSDLLAQDPEASTIRSNIMRRARFGNLRPSPTSVSQAIRQPVREAVSGRVGKTVQEAIRTPKPKRRTLTFSGPGGSMTVHPLGSRDYFTNLIQRGLDARTQRQLDKAANLKLPGAQAIAEQLQIPAELMGPEVQQGLHAINRVHSAEPLERRVTMISEPRMGRGRFGVHYSVPNLRGGWEPYLIQTNPVRGEGWVPGDVTATTVHEAGHALQHMVKGEDNQVLAAIARTDAFRNLHANMPTGSYKRYITDLRELWARAYAQYIGTRSGNKDILDSLQRRDAFEVNRGGHPIHWTEEDFAPVAEAFDQAFGRLGWRDRGGSSPTDRAIEPGGRLGELRRQQLSPETKIGREARAARRVRDALEIAQVAQLERFGKTQPARLAQFVTRGRWDQGAIIRRRRNERLTAAENKAVDIKASGVTPEEHIAYHERGLADVAALRASTEPRPQDYFSLFHKVALERRLRKREQAHSVQIAATRAAQRELENPRPQLTQALRESRQVSRGREQILGMSPRAAAHRIGARAEEIGEVAAGRQSPLLRLQQREKLLQQVQEKADRAQTPQEHARWNIQADAIQQEIDAIHESFVSTGGRLSRGDGAFYVPSKSLRDLRKVPVGGGRAISDYGISPPRKLPELSHPYTGALERTGNARFDVPGLVGTAYRRAQRYAAVKRGFDQLLGVSHATKEAAGPYAIPIRTKYAVPEDLRRVILKADAGDLTKADLKNMNSVDLQAWMKELFPDERKITADQLRNVRWIDGRVASGMASEFDFGGKLGRAVESINAPFRASVLYTKPAYALNLLQNLGTNAIRQGVFTPDNIVKALRLGKTMGTEDQARILSLVGEGLSRSLEAESGIGHTVIQGAGEWWNKVVDRYPRAAAWIHEARAMGYNTGPKMHQLLNDTRLSDDLTEITRRANKEAVEYGQMTPLERNVLKRAIFFYGWLRGSTLYTLRFPKEHPVTTAAIANTVAYGAPKVHEQTGPVPRYLEGIVRIGKNRAIDPQNINTALTPIEAAQGMAGLFQPSGWASAGELAQQFSPAASALLTLGSGKTSLGYDIPAGQSRVEGMLREMGRSLPEAVLFNRLTQDAQADKSPEERGVYPGGAENAFGRFSLGGMYPGKVNWPGIQARGIKEQRAMMSPGQRAVSGHGDFRKAMFEAAQQSGLLKGTATSQPKELKDAITLRTKRYANYANKGIKERDSDYQREAFKADTDWLYKNGKITKAQHDAGIRQAESASSDQLEGWRRTLGDQFFGGDTISTARSQIGIGLAQRAFESVTRQLFESKKMNRQEALAAINWMHGAQTRKEVVAAIGAMTQKYGLDPVDVPDAPSAP
jgi:hypothetical protein